MEKDIDDAFERIIMSEERLVQSCLLLIRYVLNT